PARPDPPPSFAGFLLSVAITALGCMALPQLHSSAFTGFVTSILHLQCELTAGGGSHAGLVYDMAMHLSLKNYAGKNAS
ncbi:MAG: hypothetical protein RR865_05035, partial [Clostridia bacterium]